MIRRLLLLTMLGAALDAAAQESRPKILVAVSIEDDSVLANFPKPVLSELEQDIAFTLVEKIHPLLPHINWQPVALPESVRVVLTQGRPVPQRRLLRKSRRTVDECAQLMLSDFVSDIDGVLVLRMIEAWDGTVYLKFVAVENGFDCLHGARRHVLWNATDVFAPTAEKEALRRVLETALSEYFAFSAAADSKQVAFRDAILQTLPAAKGIGIETAHGSIRFIIPIKWNELQPSALTIFRVSFSMQERPKAPLALVNLYLAPAAPLQLDDGFTIATPIHMCKLHSARFDPAQPPPTEAECNPRMGTDEPVIREYLSDQKRWDELKLALPNAVVTITAYHRDKFGAGQTVSTKRQTP